MVTEKVTIFYAPLNISMELCKYRNTVRIEIFEEEIKVKSCGFINYSKEEKYKDLVQSIKIKSLSNNLNKELKNIAKKCGNKFDCKRNNFELEKIEIYIKTNNKKSIKLILNELFNLRSILIFWEFPNKIIQNFTLNYISKNKENVKKGIIILISHKISIKKLRKISFLFKYLNCFFKISFHDDTLKYLLKTKNFKILKDIQSLDSLDNIYLNLENISHYLKNNNLKSFFSNFCLSDNGKFYLNKNKFDKILKLYSEYNFGVFSEPMRGNGPYFIRYSGNINNLDKNTFEILDPNKKLISTIKRENLESIRNLFDKSKVINLFLDLKSNEEQQKKDYLKILKILEEFPIFEVTLGKSEILKFENYKELKYLATKYFLIIEDLHPNIENISVMRENFDFKVYGVINNISDWKSVQPILEQEYIDRIIYIEYDKNNFEKSKKELEEYYNYIEKMPDSIYDRFYIYPDYMIEDDKKIVDFYKNHNEKRRPYYDTKGISMHYFLR